MKIKLINFLLLTFFAFKLFIDITPIKSAICVIAKQENNYIKEFVDYYLNLNFKKIFLYDNNDVNGENFTHILKKYLKYNFVKIINFRGFYKPQMKAYNDCYTKNKNIYNWIAFYDVDEFLYLINFTNINEFVIQPKFNHCSSILINWKIFGDNENLFYNPLPLKDRFTKPAFISQDYKNNRYYYSASKTLVRGGLNLSWGHFPHFLNDSIICKADGIILNKDPLNYAPDYSIAYLKHYATKSTEEYADRLNRGTVCSTNILNDDYKRSKILTYYFLFNNITKQKIEVFYNKLKIKVFNNSN